MPPVKTVISFDLDDTLYDNTDVIRNAFKALYHYLCQTYPNFKHAFPTLKTFIADAGVSRKRYADEIDFHLIRKRHISDSLQSAGYCGIQDEQAYEVFYNARQEVQLFTDVTTTLAHLARQYTLIAITTGNASPDRIGIGPFVSRTYNPHNCGYAKPDPRMYRFACDDLGIAPQQLIHVGDCLINDVQAPINAGCMAIWFNPANRTSSHAHQVVSIGQLPDVIQRLT